MLNNQTLLRFYFSVLPLVIVAIEQILISNSTLLTAAILHGRRQSGSLQSLTEVTLKFTALMSARTSSFSLLYQYLIKQTCYENLVNHRLRDVSMYHQILKRNVCQVRRIDSLISEIKYSPSVTIMPASKGASFSTDRGPTLWGPEKKKKKKKRKGKQNKTKQTSNKQFSWLTDFVKHFMKLRNGIWHKYC